jgi:hypothetical protein
VTRPAPLPTRPEHRRLDRRHQPGGDQAAQELQPAGAVLAGHDVEAQDFTLLVGGDYDRGQRVHDRRPVLLADLLGQPVQPQERVRAVASGRDQNASTCASIDLAISLTGLVDSCAIPSRATSFSTRRVNTPSR